MPRGTEICPRGAVVRLAYHAWWYGMGVGAHSAVNVELIVVDISTVNASDIG